MDVTKVNAYAVTDVLAPMMTKFNGYVVTDDAVVTTFNLSRMFLLF